MLVPRVSRVLRDVWLLILVNVGDFSWNSGVLVLVSAGLVGSAVWLLLLLELGVEAEWWDREVVNGWIGRPVGRRQNGQCCHFRYRYLVRLEAIQRQ
jgi:hypothetical protein